MPTTSKSPLLLAMIVLFGLVAGFLYNSRLDPTTAVPPIPAKFQLSSMRGLDGLKVDYSMLQSDQFTQLKIFGQLPVQPQGGGKTDPFQ